jgi:hypothetical protein
MLYAHALRSYFFACLLGSADGLRFDEELLYVGCVLHDVGLTPAYDEPVRSFEYVGADVAAELAERHGWALDRRHTLHRSIVLHMAPSISPTELPEVLLLEAGSPVTCRARARPRSRAGRCKRSWLGTLAPTSSESSPPSWDAKLAVSPTAQRRCSSGSGSSGASRRPTYRMPEAGRVMGPAHDRRATFAR